MKQRLAAISSHDLGRGAFIARPFYANAVVLDHLPVGVQLV
jgi:hypothetical protein